MVYNQYVTLGICEAFHVQKEGRAAGAALPSLIIGG